MEIQARADYHPVLAAEIAAVMHKAPREQFVDPVLLALEGLQVRQGRLAKILGIARPSVAQMYAGQRALAEKHRRRLIMVLRDAVHLMRGECDKAERGTITYEGKPFPAPLIALMRQRADEAEQVLREAEKKQSH